MQFVKQKPPLNHQSDAGFQSHLVGTLDYPYKLYGLLVLFSVHLYVVPEWDKIGRTRHYIQGVAYVGILPR